MSKSFRTKIKQIVNKLKNQFPEHEETVLIEMTRQYLFNKVKSGK
jgi:hypothetical protein